MALKYRPEIDGLRAIAVMAVVFFHFDMFGVSGGFIGVDIFFVISGYLITGLIINEMEGRSFSILDFYKRRIRRILPVAIFVCLCCFGAAYFLYDNITFLSNTHILKYALLFISNFLLVEKRGYFEPSVEDHLFLHSWSLSIEEQFYIVFPVLFSLLYKYSKNYKKIWIWLTIVSFIANLVIVTLAPRAAFYWPFTRVWELLAGSLLAMQTFVTVKRYTNPVLALLLLSILFFVYNGQIMYPGVYALVPVLATVSLLLCIDNKESYTYRILTLKPLIFTGRISYSIYMWHFPLFIVAGFLSIERLSFLSKFLLVIILYALSALSYYVIEQPFRKTTPFMKHKGPILLLLALVGSYVFIKAVATNNNGLAGNEFVEYKLAEQRKDSFLNSCQKDGLLKTNDSLMHLYKMGVSDSPASLLVYGDSHASVLGYGLDSYAKQKHQAFYTIQNPGYPPLSGLYKKKKKVFTIDANKDVLHFINTHPEITTVVLCVRWLKYYTHAYLHDVSVEGVNDNSEEKVFVTGLYNTVNTIVKMGRTVVITTPVPELRCEVNKMLVLKKLFGYNSNDFRQSEVDYTNQCRKLFVHFRRLQSKPGVEVVDISNPLLHNGHYSIANHITSYYADNNHMSYEGAKIIALPVASHVFN